MLHQAYRYFRLYPKDTLFIQSIVWTAYTFPRPSLTPLNALGVRRLVRLWLFTHACAISRAQVPSGS